MQRLSRSLVRISILLGCAFLLVLAACKGRNQQPVSTSTTEKSVLGENLFRYAKNVTAYATDYGYRMDVLNPWDSTALLGSFALVDEHHDAAKVTDGQAVVVQLPVHSVISFSSTQWSVFMQLNEISRVKGILEGRYVHDPQMIAMLKEGVIKDVGTESAMDIESVIQMRPDIILYSPYFDGNQTNLQVTGAALFPFADYLENTPLGRAEWIRVVGMMTGREEEADAWFEDIETRYHQLSGLCAEVTERPTVFSDLAFNGQWYIAGGQSYIAKLFADAGADYIWKDNPSTASFPLDSETILAQAKHADYWRVANSTSLPMTYESLKKENAIYALFDAYKNHRILVCDIQETGYFEKSQIEPDILLADFIYFFHPEIIAEYQDNYQPKYYHLMVGQ